MLTKLCSLIMKDPMNFIFSQAFPLTKTACKILLCELLKPDKKNY